MKVGKGEMFDDEGHPFFDVRALRECSFTFAVLYL